MHRFTLHLLCANCTRRSTQELDASNEPDPPTTVEELIECGALHRVQYVCKKCDCPCGELVAIDPIQTEVNQVAY